MATNTTKLVLRKPDGVDLVNVITDLDANFDKLDAVAYRHKTQTSVQYIGGDFAPAVSAWTNVHANALDLTVVGAVVGDLLEVGISALWGNQAIFGCLDIASIVAGVPVNCLGIRGAEAVASQGVQAWTGPSGAYGAIGGSVFYTVVAGDISGGNILLRPRTRVVGALAKTLYASANTPFQFWVKNLTQ